MGIQGFITELIRLSFYLICVFVNHGRIIDSLRYMLSYYWELILNLLRLRKTYNGAPKLIGKVVVITGANTGIGKVTALEMAKHGANVILGCRDIDKGNKTINESWETLPKAKIILIQLDLASLDSVRGFAKQVSQIVSRIDILINNAGVLTLSNLKTVDGFEIHFGTNHLGHFLLTLLLIERLRAAPHARIVTVSAKEYVFGKIFFDDINFEKNSNKLKAYCQSKLANILFAQELSLRLAATNITTYCLHPGHIRTEFYRNIRIMNNFLVSIAQFIWYLSPELGAQTTLYCALDESIANQSGRYYDNCKLIEKTSSVANTVTAKKLWHLSCEMVKLENRLRLME